MHSFMSAAEILLSALSCYHLDGPQVYTCGNCRTHLTSHDDIISKSFHGRHGKFGPREVQWLCAV